VSAACLETRLGAGRVARPSQDASVPRAVRVTNGQPWHREPSRRGGRCTRPELRRAKADHHALLEATDRLAPSIPAKRPAPETRRSAAVRRGAHRALSSDRQPRPPTRGDPESRVRYVEASEGQGRWAPHHPLARQR
jgi:hypothetical protein